MHGPASLYVPRPALVRRGWASFLVRMPAQRVLECVPAHQPIAVVRLIALDLGKCTDSPCC